MTTQPGSEHSEQHKRVVAKFRCNQTEGSQNNRHILLNPVTGGSEENKAFWEATPNGTLEMNITNPTAAEYFEQGGEYQLIFERVS